MWSKKTPENQSKTAVNFIHNVCSSQTVSVRRTMTTTDYRTRSISYGGIMAGTTTPPIGSSISKFDNTKYLMPSPNQIKVDAKPAILPNKINLNYQRVYPSRAAPPSSSFPTPKPSSNYSNYLTSKSPAFSSFPTPKSSSNYSNPLISKPKQFSSPIFSSTSPGQSNKRMTVKKTVKFYDGDTTIPTYQTHGRKRGEMLIINNIMFSDKHYRYGAEVDDKNLKDVFDQMGFSVTVKRDLKRNEMRSKVKDFSKKNSLKYADIAILVVMSHGTSSKTLGGTEVVGIDEQGISIEELVQCFNAVQCKSMVGKPKIFIFQCCRGDNEQFVQSDAVTAIPALADSLIAYSTLPGFLSHRDPKLGTWYVSALCEVFSEHAHEYPVEDLLKKVDEKVGNRSKQVRQTTHYENRGFKRCYLHPK